MGNSPNTSQRYQTQRSAKFGVCEHCGLNFRNDIRSYQLHIVTCQENPINTALPCDFCKKPYDLSRLANHIKQCEFNPKNIRVLCEYCNCKVHLQRYKEHVAVCCSAQIECEFCKKHLTLKDHAEHFKTCKGNPENIKIKCDRCEKKFNGVYFNEHYYQCKGSQALKISQTAPDESGKECSICLLDVKTSAESYTLHCRHKFHKTCIRDWLKKQNTCPICREEIHLRRK